MNNNIIGINRISERIKAEASKEAEKEIIAAKEQAENILAEAKASSAKETAVILKDAEEKAAALAEGAKSSAGIRQRNALLTLKVEMMEKAFDCALEKLISLDEVKYVKAMAALLASTADNFLTENASAAVYFGKKDELSAEKILTEAKGLMKVKADIVKGEKKLSAQAGFVLAIGDTEINCTADTLINSAKKTLEKDVLDILFQKS